MTQTLKKIGETAGIERKIFYGIVVLIMVVAFFYGFFVQQTIKNVVSREKTIKDTRELGSVIGDLESQYISLKNNITLDFAYAQGFKDAVKTEYISKKALGKISNESNFTF